MKRIKQGHHIKILREEEMAHKDKILFTFGFLFSEDIQDCRHTFNSVNNDFEFEGGVNSTKSSSELISKESDWKFQSLFPAQARHLLGLARAPDSPGY